jgi:hypothetical protein
VAVRCYADNGSLETWGGSVDAPNGDNYSGSFLVNAAGLANSSVNITAGASSSCARTVEGGFESSAAWTFDVQIDENVVIPLVSFQILASRGHCDAVVNYPARTTYTGLSLPQLTNVSSITYSPPAGSSLTGSTAVTSVVHYGWGVAQTNTFSVSVIPGFSPADIVRVSWDGNPVTIHYSAPDVSSCVSNIVFSQPSGSAYPVGTNVCDVSADTPSGTIFRNFKVIVVAVTNLASLYPGDTDGDGQLDWQEMIAGTDWQDASDLFRAQKVERVGNDIQVSWYGSGGISYQLEGWTLDLTTPQSVGASVAPTIPRQFITVTDTNAVNSSTSKLYRIKVLSQ